LSADSFVGFRGIALELQVNHKDERAELERLLSSDIFSRAPSLALLLRYICDRHFEGEHHLIKEYNIAVEALGRPAEFDQKKDSIVRVEAHRLRKRLRDYYQSPQGAEHEIRIELPAGGYTPVFVRRPAAADTPSNGQPHSGNGSETASQLPPEEAGRPQPAVHSDRWVLTAWACLAIFAVTGVVYAAWSFYHVPSSRGGNAATAADRPTAESNVAEVRLNAGGVNPSTVFAGQNWIEDRYFRGGSALSAATAAIEGTLQPELFRTWREGSFDYAIPLKPGVYELTLLFAEMNPKIDISSSRLFDIRINDRPVVTEFDILTEAGAPFTVTARTWKDVAPGDDGFLRLGFQSRLEESVLQGIEIVPGIPGRLRPIRIAARAEPYTDTLGHLWLPDHYFGGGKLVKRTEAIQLTEDPDLYRGERYGRFSYTLPVPPDSTYTAVLHFAETYFRGDTRQNGEGARVFDVLCNGLMLQRNFDIYKDAGGPFRAVTKTFRGLKPTPNGKLVFHFVPSRNYACINAIEILDEAGEPRAASPR
jgi:hypothetical protein